MFGNFLFLPKKAHCRSFLVDCFYEEVKTSQISPAMKTVLTQLCELYGVYFLLKKLGHFLMVSSFGMIENCSETSEQVSQRYNSLD